MSIAPSNMVTRENLTTRRHVGRRSSISLIAIHTMEAPEKPLTAENVANYFKTVNASAHWCVDNNSRVRVVKDSDTAWTLPGANSRSLNMELAGYAKQDAGDWDDDYSTDMLEIAAYTCAQWADKYDIPIRRLSSDEIRAGKKGFVGHVDVNKVYKQSTHWDPGPSFPWKYFLSRTKFYYDKINGKPSAEPPKNPAKGYNNAGWSQAYIKNAQEKFRKLGYKISADGFRGPATVAAVKSFQKEFGLEPDGLPGPKTMAKVDAMLAKQEDKKPTNKKDIRTLQKAVGANQDNFWGPDTDKRLEALRMSSYHHGRKFPSGVKFAQEVVGAKEDGSWGPASIKTHDGAVVRVQKALLLLGYNPGKIDGSWGPAVDKAYLAAKKDLAL